MAAMYAVYHGPDGLVRIARRTHRLAAILAAALRKRGVEVGGDFFDTLHVTGVDAAAIHARAAEAEIGSAPCRDRGCQYVSISVVAVTFTKKNKNNTYHQPHQ